MSGLVPACHQVANGVDVGLRDVADGDVVTGAGAIPRLVVAAVDHEWTAPADAGLRNGWHQVLRSAEPHPAKKAGLVRSDRVEVAKRDEGRPVHPGEILEHLLANLLRPRVGRFG